MVILTLITGQKIQQPQLQLNSEHLKLWVAELVRDGGKWMNDPKALLPTLTWIPTSAILRIDKD